MGSMPARPAWIRRINEICERLELLPRPLQCSSKRTSMPGSRVRIQNGDRRVRLDAGSYNRRAAKLRTAAGEIIALAPMYECRANSEKRSRRFGTSQGRSAYTRAQFTAWLPLV